MHRFVAVLLVLTFAGAPAALAQVTVKTKEGNFLYVDNWRLPKSHTYQQLVNGNRVEIGVNDVPTLLTQKLPVFDKTAFEWVFHPETGPNPKYQFTGPMPKPSATATKPAPKPATGATEPKPAPKPAPTVTTAKPAPPAPATKPAPAPVVTVVVNAPDVEDDCKNDGWKRYTNPSFKNQGDCVSWANQNGGKGKGKSKGKDK